MTMYLIVGMFIAFLVVSYESKGHRAEEDPLAVVLCFILTAILWPLFGIMYLLDALFDT